MYKVENERGYTLVELVVALAVTAIIAMASYQLFTALVNSALLMKQKAVGLSLATNQMEYLKSLPYNNLAVAGGSIVATNPLPASTTITSAGFKYKVNTSIEYVDDAFDGCGAYPTLAIKQLYCRNYPPPSSMASVTDTNRKDYKIVNVTVTKLDGSYLASVDSQIAARVAETASNTGAIFVKVIDANGNPLQGANVRIVNTTVTPNIDVSDTTDSNGIALFYDLVPDTTGYSYTVSASATGYSSLTTIPPPGTLTPTYPSLQLISQQSSYATLQLKPMDSNSLAVETYDDSGNPLGNVKVYVKGGYKKYTSTTDTTYYYDNMTPSDSRLVTNGSGLGAISDLVPGGYFFCGDTGATSCAVGNTTYYLEAAVPYGGVSPFSPIQVPTYLASSPPATTFPYGGNNYLQKVRLILTTASNAPRVVSMTPYEADQSSSNMSAYNFQITGANLPCTSSAASCGTTVKLLQGSSTFTASCTGSSAGTQINCTVNISTASLGWTSLQITSNGRTLTLPAAPPYGGINVTP